MSAIVYINKTFFSNNPVASTNYLYTDDSVATTVQTAAKGEVLVSGYNHKTLQLAVTSMDASTTKIGYRIEGRMSGFASWGEVYTASVVSATALDDLIHVTEMVDYMRIGVKRTGTGIPANSVTVVSYFGED